MGKLPSL